LIDLEIKAVDFVRKGELLEGTKTGEVAVLLAKLSETLAPQAIKSNREAHPCPLSNTDKEKNMTEK
jgi:hypothetical protein